MAARDLGPWQYTTNNGRVFVRRADKFLTAQEASAGNPNVGGDSAAALAAGSYESMPSNWTPRHVIMGATGVRSRMVVVYAPDAPLWGATPPTMSLRDAGGVATTYTVERKVDEKLGRIIGRGQ
jgi:hypothetical protein